MVYFSAHIQYVHKVVREFLSNSHLKGVRSRKLGLITSQKGNVPKGNIKRVMLEEDRAF